MKVNYDDTKVTRPVSPFYNGGVYVYKPLVNQRLSSSCAFLYLDGVLFNLNDLSKFHPPTDGSGFKREQWEEVSAELSVKRLKE